MQDRIRAHESEAQLPGWQYRLGDGLAVCYRDIAEMVSGGTVPGDFDLGLVKAGKQALSLQVVSDGCRAFLKYFDGAGSRSAYLREKAALLLLRKSGLVPEITAFSDKHQFFAIPWFDRSLDAAFCEAKGVEQVADALGTWQARYDAAAPFQPLSGNWYQYLCKFGTDLSRAVIEDAKPLLSQIPLCAQSLARNDFSLSNFVICENGDLLGVDFEKAVLRPIGWDYLLGFIALTQRFPDEVEQALGSYAQAYSRAHKGALVIDELNIVARNLFVSRAIAFGAKAEEMSWR